jgi:Rad3-related DNA helicase
VGIRVTGGAVEEAAGEGTGLTPRDLGLPFDEYRVGQGELALDVASDGKRFSLVSAPTGAGKSLIYASVAKLLGVRALVLTGTKGLQEQLIKDFGAAGLVDVRGHLNYPCAGDRKFARDGGGMGPRGLLKPEKGEAGEGVCQGAKDVMTGARDCDYLRAVQRARKSDLVVTNYAYWLMRERTEEPNLLGEFGLLILDEAHTADAWLSKTCVWKETDRTAEDMGIDLPRGANEKEWVAWARKNVGKFPRLKEIVRASEMGVEWVVKRDPGKVELTPAWGRPWAEQCLFRGIDRVVLTSATLSEDTGKYLGVPGAESTYWEAGSPFSFQRRPVIFMPGPRVQYKMGEGDRRQWMNKVDSVIDERIKHARKGIIHTVSYARAQEVYERSRHKGIMIRHGAGGVKAAVRRFKQSRGPVVLVSPSVTEGYDFPDDECRFQIIVKVPFIRVKGEAVVQARQRSDKGYADYLAAEKIIQMSGRAVRGPDDWAETIIVDGHWSWFRGKVEWPGWFKRAFMVAREAGGGRGMEVPE